MIHHRANGFTLPEVMMAMGVGSMLMLSAAQIYPLMRQRSQSLGRHYQLEELLHQTAFTIEKDVRRAGFCNGICQGKTVIIGNASGEPAGSCIIVIYDLNRNGRWENRAPRNQSILVIACDREGLKCSVAQSRAAVQGGRNYSIRRKSPSRNLS